LAFFLLLIGSKGSGLPQHRINERCLSVVNVSDDRNVTQVVAGLPWKILEVRLV
jgi:hypothetical protein